MKHAIELTTQTRRFAKTETYKLHNSPLCGALSEVEMGRG